MKEFCEKVIRVMYSVIVKCRKYNMLIDCKLDMFDKIVKFILLYGCEVWGFGNIVFVEKLYLKFCKYILNLKFLILNYMVYGEFGWYLLIINVKVCMIVFWSKFVFL